MGEDMGADTGYDVSEGEWLSYAELAQRRGIDRQSAFKLAARHRWRRQKGNTGQVRVFVPSAFAEAEDKASDTGYDVSDANKRADAALALADRTLAQLADAGQRADRAELARDRAEARAEQERLAADRYRAQAEVTKEAAERASGEAQVALERLRELEAADAARRAKGRLRRVLEAWRGR
jgi:hypothetical protein